MLDSFEIDDIGDVQWWLEDPRCPLNFSRLKALKLPNHPHVLERGILQPALKMVKLFAPVAGSTDLSAFEALRELRWLILDQLSDSHFEAISTIRPQSRLWFRAPQLRILLPGPDRFSALRTSLAALNRRLSLLRAHFPNLAIVHISIDTDHDHRGLFPAIGS
ncbi:hypothetical protein DFH09DRAFT_625723 [Mycena vulgaris]|nr:hypothetical protein DFH09DRAFT_625723 [Mycena vulgaris]